MQHPSALRGFVVLVVENNPNVLEATSYMVEAAFGCKTLGASSSAEAVALVDGGSRVDLVFSEVVLPGKDGFTLAQLVRERIPDLPVVLATECSDESGSILDRGYVPLLKPYSVQQLEGVFTELLCKSLGKSESSGPADEVASAIPARTLKFAGGETHSA